MLVRSRFINFVTRWSIYFSTTRRDENFWSRHFRIFTFNIYIDLLFNILITFRSFRIGISVWMFWIWNLDMGDTLSTYPWKKRFHYTLQQQHRSTWAKLKMRNQHYNAAHNHMCRTQWMTAKNMCRTKTPPLLCIDDTQKTNSLPIKTSCIYMLCTKDDAVQDFKWTQDAVKILQILTSFGLVIRHYTLYTDWSQY